MTSTRPYLLKAFYQWIVDNSLTPYIVVMADLPGVDVPAQYVEQDGRIVLNISPTAVRDLSVDNNHIGFSARFGGVPYTVYAPMRAVSAIYAKENGRGMVFKEDELDESSSDSSEEAETGSGEVTAGKPSAVPGSGNPDTKGGKGKGRGGRPNLTIVK